MKFVIDRAKWRTGGDSKLHSGLHSKNRTGKGRTELLNNEGFMCCLGQICSQCGVDDEYLLSMGEPEDIYTYHSTEYSNHNIGDFDINTILNILVNNRQKCDLTYKNNQLSIQAILINDDADTTPEEKEQKLASLFTEYGHELVFQGEYVR